MNAVMAALGALVRGRADLVRVLFMVLVFRPVAYVLPQVFIWPLALACAFPLVLGFADNRQYARELAAAFGLDRRAGLRLAVRSQARRFEEFSWLQKLIARIIRPETCPVSIEASDEVWRLINSDCSLVIAQAHFVRDSPGIAFYSPQVFKRRAIVVAMKPPAHNFQPRLMRVRIQLKQLLRASLKTRSDGVELAFVGAVFSTLLTDIQRERAIVSINVDAHWRPGRTSSLTRPFAGSLQRTYSTGAAKLSRLAAAPLLYVQAEYTEGKRSIRMRIAGPFTSGAPDPEVRDQEVTGHVLDHIEREVGKRPERYVLDIGGDRRWDAKLDSWRSP